MTVDILVETKFGRKQKPIDWELVDRLLESQCTGKEIAGHFNMHEQTFYDRVKEHTGTTFTLYASTQLSKGLSLLRAAQFKKAMAGNPQMQVWLGKQYLQQKDGTSIELTQQDVDKMDAFVEMLKEKQNQTESLSNSSDLNKEDNNTSSE